MSLVSGYNDGLYTPPLHVDLECHLEPAAHVVYHDGSSDRPFSRLEDDIKACVLSRSNGRRGDGRQGKGAAPSDLDIGRGKFWGFRCSGRNRGSSNRVYLFSPARLVNVLLSSIRSMHCVLSGAADNLGSATPHLDSVLRAQSGPLRS